MRHVLQKKPVNPRHSNPAALTTLAAVQLLTACSLASPPGRAVTITLPASSGTDTARTQGSRGRDNGPPPATSFSSFNCYAINVVAADIPNNPNMSCAGTPMGIIAGFVSTSAGSITVSVPDGSARTFQLIGVPSSVGCPDLPSLITSSNPQAFNGIGNPYLLGTATTDISANTAISINASFTPGVSQAMFQNCGDLAQGQGPSFPPSSVLGAMSKASSPFSGGGNSFDFPFQAVPTPALNGSEFGSQPVTTLSASAAAAQLPQSESGTQLAVTSAQGVSQIVPSLAVNNGLRSVVQLQWNATTWDLNTFPYAAIQLELAGGIEEIGSNATCAQVATTGPAGVTAAVWDPTRQQWLPLAQSSFSISATVAGEAPALAWNGGGSNYAPVNTAELLVTRSDGQKFLVINVESNYLVGSNGCSSSVHVAGANIQQMTKQVSAGGGQATSLYVNPVGEVQGFCSVSSCSFNSEPGLGFGLLVNGGTPPYTFAIAGGGTVDTSTGYVVLGANNSTVTVSDSSSPVQSTSVNFNVIARGSATSFGVQITNGTLNPAGQYQFPAGSCVSAIVSALGFGWGPIGVESATAFDVFFPGNGVFQSTNCSGTSLTESGGVGSYPSIAAQSTQATVSFNVTQESAGVVNVGLPGATTAFGTGAPILVTAGAPYSVGISNSLNLMPLTNVGYCMPVVFTLQDQYGNDITAGSATATMTSLSVTGGSAYTGPPCTTPDMLSYSAQETITATAPLTLYFDWYTMVNPVTFNATISGVPQPALSDSLPFTVLGSSQATTLALSYPNGQPGVGQCGTVNVQTTLSSGAPALPSTQIQATIGGPGPIYADSACTTVLNDSLLTLPESTGFAQFWIQPQGQSGSLSVFEYCAGGAPCSPLLNSSTLAY